MAEGQKRPWIDLDGRIALVTGAAAGIGRAAAIALAEVGAEIIVADRDEAGAATTVEAIKKAGGTAHARALDVTSEAQWAALEEEIAGQWGRIDILVNSAGIVLGDRAGDSVDVYRRIFAVNVEGSLLGIAVALRLMRPQGRGSIINMASAASLRGSQIMASYGASKAAVAHFTRSAAQETARTGTDIRVNSIHPGMTETQMAHDLYAIYGEQGAPSAQMIQRTTTGRNARPEEMADLIVYLASDRSSYISGANIPVDRALSA